MLNYCYPTCNIDAHFVVGHILDVKSGSIPQKLQTQSSKIQRTKRLRRRLPKELIENTEATILAPSLFLLVEAAVAVVAVVAVVVVVSVGVDTVMVAPVENVRGGIVLAEMVLAEMTVPEIVSADMMVAGTVVAGRVVGPVIVERM